MKIQVALLFFVACGCSKKSSETIRAEPPLASSAAASPLSLPAPTVPPPAPVPSVNDDYLVLSVTEGGPKYRLDDPESIRLIKDALKVHAVDPGPLDGVAGPRLHAALESYQRSLIGQQIARVGVLDQVTVDALGLDFTALKERKRNIPMLSDDSLSKDPTLPIERSYKNSAP